MWARHECVGYGSASGGFSGPNPWPCANTMKKTGLLNIRSLLTIEDHINVFTQESMKFFGKEISIEKLEIDLNGVSSDSPMMKKRLDRIHSNYEKLDAILAELELKISQDERISPICQDTKSKQEVSQMDIGSTELIPTQDTNPPSANPKKPR